MHCTDPKNFLRFYLGKFSLGDLFDNNQFANSPRTQFLNWCLMNNGAWDYAANLRGYTYSFATVLQWGNMTYKAALATLPIVANGGDLNTDLGQEYSLNFGADRSYKWKNRDGHLRLLAYYNNGDMGSYSQAIADGSPGNYSVISTRQYGRTRIGAGLNADQQLTDNIGAFFRAGWSDGKTETWCFTEADQSISAGLSLSGKQWKRNDDVIGIGIVANGLSNDHKNYLALGGLGFQLGDGKLNYGNETATEIYYSCKPVAGSGIWFTGDYQLVLNPGYNKDRGPVNVFSFRLHVEL
jgi:high affinity Mn2+ porin